MMRLAITGHRPDKLGGYSETNPMKGLVQEAVIEKIRRLEERLGSMAEFVTGMALGVDQWALEAVLEGKARGLFPSASIIAAVPFRGQEARWPAQAQQKYRRLLGQCDEVVEIFAPGYSAEKLLRRNEWMVTRVCSDPDHAGAVVAVWTGAAGGTQECVRFAEKMLAEGKLRVLSRIDPRMIQRPSHSCQTRHARGQRDRKGGDDR